MGPPPSLNNRHATPDKAPKALGCADRVAIQAVVSLRDGRTKLAPYSRYSNVIAEILLAFYVSLYAPPPLPNLPSQLGAHPDEQSTDDGTVGRSLLDFRAIPLLLRIMKSGDRE